MPFVSFNYLVRFFGVQSFFSGAIFYLQLFGTFFGARSFFSNAIVSFGLSSTVWLGIFVRGLFGKVPFFIFNCFARVFLETIIFARCHSLFSTVWLNFFWAQFFWQGSFFIFTCLMPFCGHSHGPLCKVQFFTFNCLVRFFCAQSFL